MGLLHQHLQMAIREGRGVESGFTSVLSTLSHFDPPQLAVIQKLWLSLMTDILGSRYEALERCRMAGEVVRLVWEQIKHEMSYCVFNVEAVSIPPLLGLLRLGEEIHWRGFELAPWVLALRILSHGTRSNDSGPTILPILASTLRPTHPLRSRKISLKAFCRFSFGWFSQMEGVSSLDRAGLLHAVGDPFQLTPDTVLLDNQYMFEDKYNPMNVVTILIEFASSDLWRDHLRRLNFASCEEVISTGEGRKSAFECLKVATKPWPFLRSPAKIILAIERLEALRCPNTVEAFSHLYGLLGA